MATENMTTSERTNGSSSDRDEGTNPLVGVMSQAQDAAQATVGVVRNVAGTAAERLPAAMTTAQDVAGQTSRTLDELPDQALVVGTSFSLGLGIGLFMSGMNRLFVLLALAPAAAMAVTLVNRGSDESAASALGQSKGPGAGA
ncbi:hypothetical protein BH20CHL5_BH20CHL5_02920 [soil metagenome]|jgi:hypothetical protein|nr:hypothetical protein [Chloroflexota bacterium]